MPMIPRKSTDATTRSTIGQLLIVIGLSAATSGTLGAKDVLSQNVPIVAHTLIVRETLHKEDGSIVALNERVEAMRSDGATVIRRIPFKEFGQEASGTLRSIFFPSGLSIQVNEKFLLKTSQQGKEVSLRSNLRDMNSYAAKPFYEGETMTGEESVAGFRTVRIQRQGVTRWLSLDYGCTRIKDRIEWGAGNGANETNLVSLIPGEPESSLFEASGGLKEVSPSEQFRIVLGSRCPSCLIQQQTRLDKEDRSYFNNRPK